MVTQTVPSTQLCDVSAECLSSSLTINIAWLSSTATRNLGSVTISIVLEHVLPRQQLSAMLVANDIQVYERQVLILSSAMP